MPAKQNWVALVKQLLGSLGFNEAWLAQSVGNVILFFKFGQAKGYTINSFRIGAQDSKSQAEQVFYSSVSSFQFKNLFKLSKGEKYRNAIASLKCLSHRLEIESGRWHKPIRKPIDERLCTNCNVVENEYHFLFKCCLHNGLRIQYMGNYSYTDPNQVKTKLQLFHSTHQKQVTDLTLFIQKAFTHHVSINAIQQIMHVFKSIFYLKWLIW